VFDPKFACLVCGAAEGETELNAFDNALLEAGIGDINLIKVSSIMPPNVKVVEKLNPLPKGAFLPVVYAAVSSSNPGAIISAAVGFGRCQDGFGVIMEDGGIGKSEEEVRKEVERKIEFALARRGLRPDEVRIVSVSWQVKKCASVVAACIFFE
jgi:arginine decarboxylase